MHPFSAMKKAQQDIVIASTWLPHLHQHRWVSEPIVRLLAKEKPPVERIVFWWTIFWRYALLGVMIRDIAKNFKYVLGMGKVIWCECRDVSTYILGQID